MSPRAFLASLDKELLLLVLGVATVGVVNLFSASQATRPGVQYYQMGYVALGLLVAAGLAALDPRWYERVAYPLYLAVCGLLVAVLVVGTTVKGSQRWIGLGPVNMQPSELMKMGMVLAMARYMAGYLPGKTLSLLELVRPLNPSRPLAVLLVLLVEFDAIAIPGAVGWSIALRVALVVVTAVWGLVAVVDATRHGWARHVWVAPLDLMIAPAVLILVEPDLGTTLIVLAIAGTIVLFVGVGWRSLAVLAVAGVAGAVVAWFKVLREYQKQRVLTFLNPEADALGAGYHANQSMIAIGSGGVQGKGFMEGTQTQLSFLPENHTDFAFSVLAEEWGLFGAAVLLVLFGLLLVKGVRIAAGARDRFGALLAVGATSVIFWQMLVNVGMVTGLLPVVGVTLPLVSYGGSSVLTVMLAVGLLLSVARRRAVR